MVKQAATLLPPGAQVVVLGDGEFDGTTLQHTMQAYGWSYVIRTGSNITILWDGDSFRCETVASCIKPGTLVALKDARMTEAAYGPILLLCCWANGYKEPLHLVTNMASADEACRYYEFMLNVFALKRFFLIKKAEDSISTNRTLPIKSDSLDC